MTLPGQQEDDAGYSSARPPLASAERGAWAPVARERP
jgi:hypothetical protein